MYHYNDTFDDANGDLAWVRQVDNAVRMPARCLSQFR
jgi:hypothetical protein